MVGFYVAYLESLCRRRGWPEPAYETYRSSSGYACFIVVNGKEFKTDVTYESDGLAQENAAMRAFMKCRNWSVNGGMLARNGIVQGLPASDDGNSPRLRRPSDVSTSGESETSAQSIFSWMSTSTTGFATPPMDLASDGLPPVGEIDENMATALLSGPAADSGTPAETFLELTPLQNSSNTPLSSSHSHHDNTSQVQVLYESWDFLGKKLKDRRLNTDQSVKIETLATVLDKHCEVRRESKCFSKDKSTDLVNVEQETFSDDRIPVQIMSVGTSLALTSASTANLGAGKGNSIVEEGTSNGIGHAIPLPSQDFEKEVDHSTSGRETGNILRDGKEKKFVNIFADVGVSAGESQKGESLRKFIGAEMEGLSAKKASNGNAANANNPPTINASPTIPRNALSTSKWEDLKSVIEGLYIDESMPFRKIAAILLKSHSFSPTKDQFHEKIKQWGFQKHGYQEDRCFTMLDQPIFVVTSRTVIQQTTRDSWAKGFKKDSSPSHPEHIFAGDVAIIEKNTIKNDVSTALGKRSVDYSSDLDARGARECSPSNDSMDSDSRKSLSDDNSSEGSLYQKVCDVICNQDECEGNLASPILDPMKQALVDRVMAEFWILFNHMRAREPYRSDGLALGPPVDGDQESTNGSEATTSSTSSTPSFQRTKSTTPQKRLCEKGNDEEDGDQRKRAPSKRCKLPSAGESGIRFACPFRKHDPRTYTIHSHRSCTMNSWGTIARIKEHLYRCHQTAPHCQRCWLVFQAQQDLSLHMTVLAAEICEVKEGSPPKGINAETERQLRCRKRSQPHQSEEDTWRDVYRILFPNEDIPSPYFDPIQQDLTSSPETGEIADYEDYIRRELPPLVRRNIEEAVRQEMQPLEASLIASLVDIVRDCQETISRAYRQGSSVATDNRHTELSLQIPTVHDSQSMATRRDLPDFLDSISGVPPPQEWDYLGLSTDNYEAHRVPSQLTEQNFQDSGYGGSMKDCNCETACSCQTPEMTARESRIGGTFVVPVDIELTNEISEEWTAFSGASFLDAADSEYDWSGMSG